MKLNILTFCLLLIFGSCSTNFKNKNTVSRNYYFSVSGNNQNNGTLKSPFKSLNKLSEINLNPGDSILLKGGDIFFDTLRITLNGTKDNPIVITSYDKNRATINSENKEAIIISGNWFHLKNINVKGSGRKTGNISHGISIFDVVHSEIENIRTEGFQKCGLSIYKSSEVGINNVHSLHNGSIGISVYESHDCSIKDCLAENNPGDPTNLTNHSGNGILVGESKRILIDHCVATNNGWDMPRQGNGPVGIWAYQSDSVTIQYCISYKNHTSEGAKDGGGFDFDGGITNSVIQYCLSYENDGAGFGLFQYYGARQWNNNSIRYNISLNDGLKTDGSGGIFIWNGGPTTEELANCLIHNNLIINNNKPAVIFENASNHKNFLFINNIFIGSGEIVSGPTSGEKFMGNIWWNTDESQITFRGYKSLLKWATATGQEFENGKLIGMQTNPMLTGLLKTELTDPYQLDSLLMFELDSESPLKNKGLNIEFQKGIALPQTDFFKNQIPQGRSLEPGIFEITE